MTCEETLEAVEWELRVAHDAMLRAEAILVARFGQPTDGSLLSLAHLALRIAFRKPGAFYDYLHRHSELLAVLDSNPVPPIEWEREGREYKNALDFVYAIPDETLRLAQQDADLRGEV